MSNINNAYPLVRPISACNPPRRPAFLALSFFRLFLRPHALFNLTTNLQVVNKAIAAIKTTVQLKMRLNPKFKGVDAVPEADDEKDWYQVFR